MIAALQQMVDRFMEVLDCIDATFIEPGLLDALPQPSQVGRVRVGGVDLNKARMRAVAESVLALSPLPHGFSASDVAERVRASLADDTYTTSRAAYDLRKLRGKGLVSKFAALTPLPGMSSSAARACGHRHSARSRHPSSSRGCAPLAARRSRVTSLRSTSDTVRFGAA